MSGYGVFLCWDVDEQPECSSVSCVLSASQCLRLRRLSGSVCIFGEPKSMPALSPRECRVGQGRVSLESGIALTTQEKNKVRMLLCSIGSTHCNLAVGLQDQKKELSVTTIPSVSLHFPGRLPAVRRRSKMQARNVAVRILEAQRNREDVAAMPASQPWGAPGPALTGKRSL